jgi:cobalamin biosynthesis Mg chelatase CobN
MSLSRKRRKALKRLKGTAEDLWLDQQAVLDRANAILREAGKQASFLADEEVKPRVKSAVGTVAPTITRNVAAVKVAGQTAKNRFSSDVIPALASTVGSAAAVMQLARNPEFVQQAGKKASKAAKSLQKTSAKSSGGSKAGLFVVVTLGVVTALGLGYALWQTFRADDELWIADEDPEPETNPES